MQLRSPTTRHAVHIAVHGRRAPPRTDEKLAWTEPSPGRHRAEAKYALAAKFLDAELTASAAAHGAPVSGALARGRGRGRALRRSAATAELLDVVVRAP